MQGLSSLRHPDSHNQLLIQCALRVVVHSDREHLPSNLCIFMYCFVTVRTLRWADPLPRRYAACQKYTHSRNFDSKQTKITTPKGGRQFQILGYLGGENLDYGILRYDIVKFGT